MTAFLTLIGFARSPLGRAGGAVLIALALVGYGWVRGSDHVWEKVRAEQAAYEADIARIREDALRRANELTEQLNAKDKELADALDRIAAATADDDGTGGLDAAAGLRLNTVR